MEDNPGSRHRQRLGGQARPRVDSRYIHVIYDVDSKLLNGIRSMYVNSLACFRVKGSESECFRIISGVGLYHDHVPLVFQCIYGCRDEGGENGEEGRK